MIVDQASKELDMITDPFVGEIPVLENGIELNRLDSVSDTVVAETMVTKALANFRKGSVTLMSRRKEEEDLEDNVTTTTQDVGDMI